jgi:hypothetical protein
MIVSDVIRAAGFAVIPIAMFTERDVPTTPH